jgi:integrase
MKQKVGWTLTITPEAGTVKDKQAREVPLHLHLIDLGFVDFVNDAPTGYLFVRPSKDGEVIGPMRGAKNRVREFVRGVVKDKDVAPNHGWRHRLKTVGREVGIEERVLDAICGHAPGTVGGGYGDVTLKTKAAAIVRLPRYEVTPP